MLGQIKLLVCFKAPVCISFIVQVGFSKSKKWVLFLPFFFQENGEK